ncbi:hypothetical protein J7M23_00680, partial [Candidatus Sumerlaeota bacterium]|nr:hypothetical protein [Candidatus Sumerlaeota bacterium]
PDEQWIEEQDAPQPQVLYFIYYGNEFKRGISLLKDILGDVPPVPEWIMGIWFSCYRKMGEKAFRKLKEDFDKYRLPLDVIVVDTDWHKHWWHGFDWNKRLFPEPSRFARWLRRKHLHAVFNVHPQYIPQKDSRLPKFIKETSVAEVYLDEDTAPHPFHKGCLAVDLFDKKQALAYFRIFHNPIEQAGCDIWWIDGSIKDTQGRESTTWLNHIYFRYANQSSDKETSIVLSRGYGLGSHRSAILFTGDTLSQWSVLEQEVIMTPMASNCLFSYVSHDIGGFISGSPDWKENKPPDDLYIRWVQFGCLSPIMRFHSDHGIREPWKFKKETLRIVRNFLHFRTCLRPYLMQLVHIAHKTGVALCRPMYYEFPDDEDAYRFQKQYMLGDAMLVSPVTSEDSRVTTWFPRGTWYHCFTERIIRGPAVISEKVPLNIMPVYVREGHSIPYIPYTKQTTASSVRKRKSVYSYKPEKVPLCVKMGIKMME